MVIGLFALYGLVAAAAFCFSDNRHGTKKKNHSINNNSSKSSQSLGRNSAFASSPTGANFDRDHSLERKISDEEELAEIAKAIKLDLDYLAEHGMETTNDGLSAVYDLNFSKDGGGSSEFLKEFDRWLKHLLSYDDSADDSDWNFNRRSNRLNSETFPKIEALLSDSEVNFKLFYAEKTDFAPMVRVSTLSEPHQNHPHETSFRMLFENTHLPTEKNA